MGQAASILMLKLFAAADCFGYPMGHGFVWPQMHENFVYFQHVDHRQLLSMDWSGTGHSVTEDQPFKGSFIEETDAGGAIVVLAGRCGSARPAVDFLHGATSSNIIGAGMYLDNDPPINLNFAIIGTIRFTWGGRVLTCDNMRVGQGHDWFSNPWWVGASYCIRRKTRSQIPDGYVDGPLICNCDGGRLAFYSTDTANKFGVNLEFEFHIGVGLQDGAADHKLRGVYSDHTRSARDTLRDERAYAFDGPSSNYVADGVLFNGFTPAGACGAALALLLTFYFVLARCSTKPKFADASTHLVLQTKKSLI